MEGGWWSEKFYLAQRKTLIPVAVEQMVKRIDGKEQERQSRSCSFLSILYYPQCVIYEEQKFYLLLRGHKIEELGKKRTAHAA